MKKLLDSLKKNLYRLPNLRILDRPKTKTGCIATTKQGNMAFMDEKMFGISTAWRSPEILDGDLLIDEMEKTGIPGIELDYRITVQGLEQIKKRLRNSSLRILSLHNYCPYPEPLDIQHASGDGYSLASLDENERQLAVRYSIRTLQQAHELGAIAVVFHLGRVEIDRENERWFELFKNGHFADEPGRHFFETKLQERKRAQPAHFKALLQSLEELNREAEKLSLWIGIENRYYYDQLPNYQEIGDLLDHFAGGRLRYWHDTGHAQTAETFGLARHEQFLQRYGHQLIGIHLHDAQTIGYNDHFAPGSGMIDFHVIQRYLPDQAIRIIEAHPKVSLDELKQGVTFLKETGII